MKTTLRLLRLVGGYWRTVTLAVIFGWATAVSWVALMTTSAYLISAAALHPSVAELQVAIVGVRFFGISRGIFRYLERYVSHTVTFRLLAKLRTDFYRAVEPLAPAGLWEYESGDLLGRVVDDIDTLQEFYVRIVAPPAIALLASGGVLIFFGRWGWKISFALLGFQLFCGVVVPLLTRRLSTKPGREMISQRAELRSVIGDSFGGIEDIVANNQQSTFIGRFSKFSEKLGKAQRRHFWIEGLHGGLITLGVNLGMLLVLILAIQKVSAGELDGRLLAVLTLGAVASFEAILPLPLAFQNLESTLKGGGRLFEIMDQPVEIPSLESDFEIESDKFSLSIKNLSFSYSKNSEFNLAGFDLQLRPGRKVAIVGASGAGKTTILKLLQRYWEYEDGEILLNGIDLRQIDGDQVRACFSVISQDSYLFNAPIDQNLKLAKPHATLGDLLDVVEQVELTEFIEQLPQGFQTWVGEFGTKVSGGQRQRLAIGRSILKDAPILLLDEPTANLDPVTEQDVLRNLLEGNVDKGILLVSHRLVGMEAMDEIIVLEKGKIVERGRHEEMVEFGGRYARMWEIWRSFLRSG